MAEFSFTYRAFISYAHADHQWAVWLHRALERYRVPRRIAGAEGLRRLGKIFRDEDELAAAAELGPRIEAALRTSDVLIVVCSPRSAKSKWVNQEIEAFKRLGRTHRVFALIVDGEPHGAVDLECFPEALKCNPDGSVAEPLAVDIRKFGREDAALRLVAGMLDVGYDELHQREVRRRRAELFRAQALFVSGLVLVAAALTGGWFAADNFIKASERYTEQFARDAQTLANEGDGATAMLMALAGDPTGETRGFGGWLERTLRPEGFIAARNALIAGYTHTQLLHSFDKHTAEVTAVAYSPDGKMLLSGSYDGTAILWPAGGGPPIRTIEARFFGPGGDPSDDPNNFPAYNPVSSVAFSPDGKMIAIAGRGLMVGPVDGGELRLLLDNQEMIEALAFSPDSKTIFAANALWSVEGGDESIARYGDRPAAYATAGGTPDSRARSVAFSGDGKTLLIGTASGTARLWPIEGGTPLATYQNAHRGSVTAVMFAPNPEVIVTGGSDGKVMSWPINGGPDFQIEQSVEGSVTSAALSPATYDLLIGSTKSGASLWRLEGELSDTVPLGRYSPNSRVNAVVFSPDGRTFAMASSDQTVSIWSTTNAKPDVRYLGHPAGQPIEALAFSPDGRNVLTGATDSTAKLWAVEGGEALATLSPNEGWVDGVAFSPDGSTILTEAAGRARVWTREGVLVRELGEKTTYQATGALAPDGRSFVTDSGREGLRVWPASGGAPVDVPTIRTGKRTNPEDLMANRMSVSPDGASVLTSSASGAIRLRQIDKADPEVWFDGHRGAIWALAFSPDSKTILSVSQDMTAKIWPASGGKPLSTFVQPEGLTVSSGSFSPIEEDGLWVAVSGDTARIWSTAGGAPLVEFFEPTHLFSAIFSPDGRSLLTGGYRGAQLWRIPDIVFAPAGDVVSEACAMLDRIGKTSFTERDRIRFSILRGIPDDPCSAIREGGNVTRTISSQNGTG